MFTVIKSLEISAAHKLNLSYESKCQNLHGHNWKIKIYCRAKQLNADGMVFDFTHIKQAIHDRLDHTTLNSVLSMNPTAENIGRWIADTLGEKCYRVEVQESDGNLAIYEKDE